MKHKTLLYCLFGVLPVVTVIRILQLIYTINPQDGFNYTRFNTLTVIINAALVAVCFVFIIAGLFLKRPLKIELPKFSYSWSIGSFVMSFALFGDVLVKVLSYSTINMPTTISMVVVLLDFIMGLLFFCSGYCNAAGKKIPNAIPLFTVVWSVVVLVLFYKNFNGIVFDTENTINLMALCTSMLFWLNYAHICADYHSEKSVRSLYIFGSLSAIFCTLCTVPRIILTLIGNTEVLNSDSNISLINIGTVVFVIIFMMIILKGIAGNKKINAPVEENNSQGTILPGETTKVQINEAASDSGDKEDIHEEKGE